MAALEANKQIKTSFDPGSSTGALPGDFPPGARRPDDQRSPVRSPAPYRAPEAPQPTLAERIAVIEQHVTQAHTVLQDLRRDTAWLTAHWHQAIDRANEQLGDGARALVPRWLYWVSGMIAGMGLGLLSRGLF